MTQDNVVPQQPKKKKCIKGGVFSFAECIEVDRYCEN